MAHSNDPNLSQTDFNDLFTDVKQAFTALGFPLTRISQLEAGVLSTDDYQQLKKRLHGERNR